MRMLLLASGDNPVYQKSPEAPILVAIDFEGGTTKETVNEAGIAVLDPYDLEDSKATTTEFSSKISTHHMLVAGREHIHPHHMSEKKMGIFKNDQHADRPRWKFPLGPRKDQTQWIRKSGNYYQKLAADTEIGVRSDRVAPWLEHKLVGVKHCAGHLEGWPATMAGSKRDVKELDVSQTFRLVYVHH